MPASSVAASAHARIASLSRDREPTDPDLLDARRELTAAKLAAHVEKVVNGWPPLTHTQLDRIASLLRAGRAEK